jgi:hypothetical protein
MKRDPLAPKTKYLIFRASEELRAYVIERAREDSIATSDVLRAATELHRDLHELLGADWYEVRKRAGVNKQSLGAVLAGLIRIGLQPDRRTNNNNR